ILGGANEAAKNLRGYQSDFAQQRAARQAQALKAAEDDSIFSGLEQWWENVKEAPDANIANLAGSSATPIGVGGTVAGLAKGVATKGVNIAARKLGLKSAAVTGALQSAGEVRQNYYNEIKEL